MTYRITGLDPKPFLGLQGLSDDALRTRGARRMIVDVKPGFPDRIALRDAEPGEAVILLNHEHQPAATPFRASHAIFVIEGETRRFDKVGELPPVMATRTMSIRAFDAHGMMTDGALASGAELEPLIARMLATPETAYLHAHYAARGCYAARIDRA
jgi:hypothetical protein